MLTLILSPYALIFSALATDLTLSLLPTAEDYLETILRDVSAGENIEIIRKPVTRHHAECLIRAGSQPETASCDLSRLASQCVPSRLSCHTPLGTLWECFFQSSRNNSCATVFEYDAYNTRCHEFSMSFLQCLLGTNQTSPLIFAGVDLCTPNFIPE